MEGFYAVYFTGASGMGQAIVVFSKGLVTGASQFGGTIDGEYKVVAGGRIKLNLVFTATPGSTLATGQTVTAPHSQTIIAELPASFADGQSIRVQTPLGPLTTSFKKLRSMP